MKFKVTSSCVKRKSGKKICESHVEIIDTNLNPGFKDIKTAYEIKQIIENFWNNLHQKSSEVIFVQEVLQI
jgi:hypothetical protein